MLIFKHYLSKFSDYLNDVVNYYQDLYKLITLKDKFVLTELTDRAFQSPEGIFKFDVKILGIRLTSIIVAVGEKYVSAAADYGNESAKLPEKFDPLARQDFHKLENLIGIESIVSRSDIGVATHRRILKTSINADESLQFSALLLNKAFKNWDANRSLNDQIRYVVMQMAGKLFFNVHELPQELTTLIARAENTLLNFDQASTKELDLLKKEIKEHSDKIITQHYEEIIKNKPYATQFIDSIELEKLLKANPIGSLIVEGNMTTLLMGAILILGQNKEIFHNIKKEGEQLDLSNIHEVDLNKLKTLPYLDSFYLECLRFFAPNPPLVRYVSKSAKLADLDIDARTRLFVPMRAIMHHPSLWNSPQEFNPGRKINNQSYIPGVFPFIPFSTGRRTCPASHSFTQVIIKMAAVLLTKNYDCDIKIACEDIPVATKQPRFKQTYFMSLKPVLSSIPQKMIFSSSKESEPPTHQYSLSHKITIQEQQQRRNRLI